MVLNDPEAQEPNEANLAAAKVGYFYSMQGLLLRLPLSWLFPPRPCTVRLLHVGLRVHGLTQVRLLPQLIKGARLSMAPRGMTTDDEDHGDAPAQPLDPTAYRKQPAADKAPAAAAGQKLNRKKSWPESNSQKLRRPKRLRMPLQVSYSPCSRLVAVLSDLTGDSLRRRRRI